MSDMETQYFECQCHSHEHTIQFTLNSEDKELYLSVFLNDWDAWYKRLWKAIKYIFGYKCQYGHWDSWILRHEDAARLEKLLTELRKLK